MQRDNTDRSSRWSPAPATLELQPHLVDIWRISLDLSTDSVKFLESSLSEDESQRAARFQFTADRDRFIAAHGCLRHTLARYFHCQPDQLSFSAGEYGKPALSPHQKIDFNLSHSGKYALIAVAYKRKVGVDLERIRGNMEFENIAKRYFSPREVSELMDFPPEQRATAFFNCWTRKEAYIKAHGAGLSLPLDSFEVSLDEPAVLRATYPQPGETARWALLSLEVESGYAGALAVEGVSHGKALKFRYWNWSFVP